MVYLPKIVYLFLFTSSFNMHWLQWLHWNEKVNFLLLYWLLTQSLSPLSFLLFLSFSFSRYLSTDTQKVVGGVLVGTGLWVTIIMIMRNVLKSLLSWHGWMQARHGSVSWSARVWMVSQSGDSDWNIVAVLFSFLSGEHFVLYCGRRCHHTWEWLTNICLLYGNRTHNNSGLDVLGGIFKTLCTCFTDFINDLYIL